MPRNLRKSPSVMLILLVIAAGVGVAAQGETRKSGSDPILSESLEIYSWPLPDGAAFFMDGRAVYLAKATEDCLAARLLLRTPRLVLVDLVFSYNLQAGVVENRFVDVLSGWSLLERRFTVLRFRDSREALDRNALIEKVATLADRGEVPVPRVLLITSAGSELRVEISDPAAEVDEAVQEAIALQGFEDELRYEAPEEVLSRIREVRSLVCDRAGRGRFCLFEDVLSTLDQSLSRLLLPQQPAASATLTEEPQLVSRQSELVIDAEAAEVLGLFPSFDPDDPMAGSCAGRDNVGR